MKNKVWKTYALWILLTEAVGALAGWLTRRGMQVYDATIVQPALSPPNAVFPIVWGILFALMGIGGARIYLLPVSEARTRSLRLFGVQLAFNFLWSIVFFNFQWFGFAFFWLLILWLLILWMIFSFYHIDKTAAWMQVPYFLWVTFAAYLNYSVWMLNR